MGKAEKEQLNLILCSHLNTIHETLQVLDQTAPSGMNKVSWEEVKKMGDKVSKQATIVGMLWTGETPQGKAIEENMAAYFNELQGFLLLSHGSTVGAGPTLSSSIHASVKQVIDSSFRLMKESLSFYGSHNKDKKQSIAQLVGAVWEACSALKKTPVTNIAAIGRSMTQVAVSMKDVLREMKELKPYTSNDIEEPSDQASVGTECEPCCDNASDDELGNDLTPEEMEVAQLSITVVSDTLSVIKELIRSITGLIKLEKSNGNASFVNSLEKLLQLCQEIGAQIDELGASLYPPQEVSAINEALRKIQSKLDDMQEELKGLEGTSEVFVKACNGLKSSIGQLESRLKILSIADLESKLHDVRLSN